MCKVSQSTLSMKSTLSIMSLVIARLILGNTVIGSNIFMKISDLGNIIEERWLLHVELEAGFLTAEGSFYYLLGREKNLSPWLGSGVLR